MRYQGKYTPSFPRKYKGDPSNVIYRSSWEYKFRKWCDVTPSVQEWGSEEIIIPYISPVDGTPTLLTCPVVNCLLGKLTA